MMRILFAAMLLLTSVLAVTGQASAQSELRYTVAQQVQTQTDEVFVSSVGSCTGLRGIISDFNDKGEVVGFLPKGDGRGNAFIWTGEELVRLRSGKGGGVGLSINNSSEVVGISYLAPRTEECEVGQKPVPAQWIGGEYTPLELLDGTDSGSAYDINEDGLIVGDLQVSADSLARLPVVWHHGLVKQLSVAVPAGGPTFEYSSTGVFRGASATSVGEDGEIYGWGEVVDDRGIRPWRFPVIWADLNADPVIVGELDYSIKLSGAGKLPIGIFTDDDFGVHGIQYQDAGIATLPWPADTDILGLDVASSGDGDEVVVGNYYVSGVGYGPGIWDWRDGSADTAKVYDLRTITDGIDEDLILEVAIDINASGQILVQARNSDYERSFVILDPART